MGITVGAIYFIIYNKGMLKKLEMNGFKSFAKKSELSFDVPVTAIVGPNGSGKSNVVEAIRFVLGEQSIKSLRGKSGVDMIFKGSKNLSKMSRASVSITFDNSNKLFSLSGGAESMKSLDFDDVVLSREVFADGASSYMINGTNVRLKDIHELLGSVNIGSSGHHIISQGEADRILNASSKDRRGMIEDALGLRVFQFRLRESERKLDKTKENIKEVNSLRREIAPHIGFLKKQVEKISRAEELRTELGSLYRDYLKREEQYLSQEESTIGAEKKRLDHAINELELFLSAKVPETVNYEIGAKESELVRLDKSLNDLRRVHDEVSRKLGRIEAMIEMEERRATMPAHAKKELEHVSFHDVRTLVSSLVSFVDQAMATNDFTQTKSILEKIKQSAQQFISHQETKHAVGRNEPVQAEINDEQISALKKSQSEIVSELSHLKDQENKLIDERATLRSAIDQTRDANRDDDKKRFEYSVKKQELLSTRSLLAMREEAYIRAKTAFDNELAEGFALIGEQIRNYTTHTVEHTSREGQQELHKKIERIKIKLEDAGASGGGDVIKEYNDVTERDNFLVKELADLSTSMQSLNELINDLKLKLDTMFKDGVEKINLQFDNFFKLMFGGGSAFLSIVVEHKKKRAGGDDEEGEVVSDIEDGELDFERGIEIHVSLPQKKVKDLYMLSGGERSLTSIALLFAISQVNPPPFLVLDETDAALDEANSRRYGDMLESLAHSSRLIVVTHNRETMSRAQVLYGVTIGSDGASKLLSVKFDEAQAFAK
jgi:chromosome segregation ATPase